VLLGLLAKRRFGAGGAAAEEDAVVFPEHESSFRTRARRCAADRIV
jgi:hypothetical protein